MKKIKRVRNYRFKADFLKNRVKAPCLKKGQVSKQENNVYVESAESKRKSMDVFSPMSVKNRFIDINRERTHHFYFEVTIMIKE